MTLSIFYTALYFFSFCNKIFLNNKWGVSCFLDSALNRFVEVSGLGAWADGDAAEWCQEPRFCRARHVSGNRFSTAITAGYGKPPLVRLPARRSAFFPWPSQ